VLFGVVAVVTSTTQLLDVVWCSKVQCNCSGSGSGSRTVVVVVA